MVESDILSALVVEISKLLVIDSSVLVVDSTEEDLKDSLDAKGSIEVLISVDVDSLGVNVWKAVEVDIEVDMTVDVVDLVVEKFEQFIPKASDISFAGFPLNNDYFNRSLF